MSINQNTTIPKKLPPEATAAMELYDEGFLGAIVALETDAARSEIGEDCAPLAAAFLRKLTGLTQ